MFKFYPPFSFRLVFSPLRWVIWFACWVEDSEDRIYWSRSS
uniref:Uncharacterized protein n=1 Tax=Setaria viridis TaxID=4556 RepID=A0A4U6VG15_SETVI|nr:hypothetical protein SEVIR_3G174501v2 [Setaria viridis]